MTGNIPQIGESYLLRQGVNLCLEVFLLFEYNSPQSIDNLLYKHPKGIGQETLYNILIELRNLGIVQKADENYYITDNIIVSREGFIEYITKKFQNYTPYLHLKKLTQGKITKADVIFTLKTTFKQEFQDNTWDSYAKNIISWFLLSDLDIKGRFIEPKKGRTNKNSYSLNNRSLSIPRSSIKEILELIPLLENDSTLVNSKFNRDLLLLDVINLDNNLTDFGRDLIFKNESETLKSLKEKAIQLPKMKELKDLIVHRPKTRAKELIGKLPIDFFDGEKESSKIIYATKALTWVR